MIYPCGGRITNFMNCIVGIVSMFITFIALANENCSIWLLYLCAIGCGIGGGGFSSNLNNISFFAPRRLQGTFTGINAGLGNLGVSVAQRLVPFVRDHGLCVPTKSGTCEGNVMGGKYP